MRRRNRILLVVIGFAASIALVLGLLLVGTASSGPLSSFLTGVGSAIGRIESDVVRRARGPGRSANLEWVSTLRTNADSLRSPSSLLLGAYDDDLPDSFAGFLELESSIETEVPIVQSYVAWGDASEHRFPRRLVEATHNLGSVPLITWEPWIETFENELHRELPLRGQRDKGGLRDIANGLYDFYITEWATSAAAVDGAVMVRFAHEMNDPYRYPWGPQNNEAQDFIDAWRHVVDIFKEVGADNVVWVWSPHVAYSGYEAYWPGDDYVGWVATGALNYGTVAYWSEWWSFDQIFGQHYEFLVGFDKPIMIAEFGSLAIGGDRAEWYREALEDFRDRFPEVHALVFFNVDDDQTVTRQGIDWSLSLDPEVLAAVRESLEEIDLRGPAVARGSPDKESFSDSISVISTPQIYQGD